MKKHCKICRAILHRWGRTSTGKQRWKCPVCLTTNSLKRADVSHKHQSDLFRNWLCGTDTLSSLSKHNNRTRKTLAGWFIRFWAAPPAPIYPKLLSDTYLVVDAVYLAGHHKCVLIGRTGKGHVFWLFAEQETFAAWYAFLSKLPKPAAVICDGQSGLLSVLKTRWPDVPMQRCLAHIQRLGIQKLTRRPHTPAGQELLALVYALHSTKTAQDRNDWIASFAAWDSR